MIDFWFSLGGWVGIIDTIDLEDGDDLFASSGDLALNVSIPGHLVIGFSLQCEQLLFSEFQVFESFLVTVLNLDHVGEVAFGLFVLLGAVEAVALSEHTLDMTLVEGKRTGRIRQAVFVLSQMDVTLCPVGVQGHSQSDVCGVHLQG